VNTVGSYFCVCEDNYILYPGDGASCQKRAAEPPRVPNQRLSSAVGVSFLFMVLTGAAGFGLYKYRMRVCSTAPVELASLCDRESSAASFAVQYMFPGLPLRFRPFDTGSCIHFSGTSPLDSTSNSLLLLNLYSDFRMVQGFRELSGFVRPLFVLRLPICFTVCTESYNEDNTCPSQKADREYRG
jgi:hypothetical protein